MKTLLTLLASLSVALSLTVYQIAMTANYAQNVASKTQAPKILVLNDRAIASVQN